MTLRLLIAGLALLAAPMPALAQAAPAPTPASAEIAVRHIDLPAPDGRTIQLSVWPAANERGVVVFSHGFNGSPGAYHRILSAWAAHGYTVMAPLHVDSLQHPEHAKYDNRAAFGTRIMDLAVARGYARMSHPGRPLIAAGHSFGSLMSLMEGGAVTVAGPFGDPEVKGVIAFSTAGDVPGSCCRRLGPG